MSLPPALKRALFFQGFAFWIAEFITSTKHFSLLCPIRYQNIHENLDLESDKIISSESPGVAMRKRLKQQRQMCLRTRCTSSS